MSLNACHCCGQVHRLIDGSDSTLAYACTRCGTTIANAARSQRSSQRTAAAAMAALLLFPAAIFLPILEIEKLGHRYHSSIVGGIFELYAQGSWFVATIILAFSIVLPIIKLVTLLELCWFRWLEHHHRATAYRIIEFSGRWSMLDVMLLAFLVMLVKLSGIVEFQVGPAVVAFAGCVAMSMIASMLFDPHSIWGE
ncbi:MAG: paraquat-inducible protein A [Planctomycetaceae bacterium]|nr:paraquat-inducible protein A [Planctomycetaceae bacterium]